MRSLFNKIKNRQSANSRNEPLGALFYNRQYNVSYLRIPKCACTTIERWLIQHHKYYNENPTLPGGVHSQFTQEHYFDACTPDENSLKNSFRFTFTRDPYNRFLSFYKNKIDTDEPEQHIIDNLSRFGIYPHMPIQDCARKLSEVKIMRDLNMHIAPQHLFVFRNGQPRVDFVGRLENFTADLKYVSDKMRTNIPYNVLNQSENKKVELSSQTKQLIAAAYAKDFQLLDYQI